MAQLKTPYNEINIPFAKMSYTPDVPSSALGPNEYNVGSNIETDVRGIRSVAGDLEILQDLTGTPIYVTGGFRSDGNFWFVVATVEGRWYANDGTGWVEITPNDKDTIQPAIVGYTVATNITEAWNGTVLAVNDTVGAPMFWPDYTGAIMCRYGDLLSLDVSAIAPGVPTAGQVTITYTTPQAAAVFDIGGYINMQGTNTAEFNQNWLVVASTTTEVVVQCPITVIALGATPTVNQAYVWNYQPDLFTSVTAGFMRMYSTPNVGSILVAGNLTYTDINNEVKQFPVTVQWSQNFGLDQMPATWEPTITNVANQLEVPLRGPAQDAFPMGGQLFICSYWDTVVFSPINYSTTAAPIIGVRQFNQGRGLLNPNCCVNTDKLVYGIDARDIWVFDGASFQGLGNQRVKNWFFEQVNVDGTDMIHMEVNTQKNQIEIYYPDDDATVVSSKPIPNKMLAYRYDLDLWQPPRDVNLALFTCESPVWYDDTGWTYDPASRVVVYIQAIEDSKLVMKDRGTSFLNSTPIASEFRRDNIKLSQNYSDKVMVHRLLPEAVNLDTAGVQVVPSTGSITVTMEGAQSVGSSPSVTNSQVVQLAGSSPWAQFNQNAFRVNTVVLSNTSDTNIWMCTGINWQVTAVEDDR
jgi:hypothetical protein